MQGVTWAHQSPAGWLRRPPPQVPPTPWPASPWDPVTLASFLFLASGPSRAVPSAANTVPSAQPTPASPSAHRLHATPPSCPEPSPLPSRGDTPRGARLLSLQKPLPHDSLAQQGTSPERESVTSLSVTPPPLAPPVTNVTRGPRLRFSPARPAGASRPPKALVGASRPLSRFSTSHHCRRPDGLHCDPAGARGAHMPQRGRAGPAGVLEEGGHPARGAGQRLSCLAVR